MKYCVKILEVHETIVEIEAESEEDARFKAEACLSKGAMPNGESVPEGHYGYTLDRSEWPVWEN